MDPFVKRFHPEYFDLWKAGIFKSSGNGKLGVYKSKRRRCPSASNSSHSLAASSSSSNINLSQSSTNTKISVNKRASRSNLNSWRPKIDELVYEARSKYNQLWHCSLDESDSVRHRVEQRNFLVTQKDSLLNTYSLGDIQSARSMLDSIELQSSTTPSLIKLTLKK